ncbi:LptA/OstA family protein [Sporomusa aerivorans]|uniref:LptA/OstA family protein n=1 Tax=Sporomusa aerivorans TaxID=204936 RepID=UPI00352BC40F
MRYKILVSTLLVLFLLTGISAAAKPTITADRTYFDINTGLYVLNGNVYIQVGNRVITAGQAKVNPATLEVWAAGGITVTQDDIYFTGNSVYVYGTKDRATIDGGVNLSRDGLSITADNAEFNWHSKIADFKGNVQVTQNGNSWSADSASYNVKTNCFL